jgi:hypothetical protein
MNCYHQRKNASEELHYERKEKNRPAKRENREQERGNVVFQILIRSFLMQANPSQIYHDGTMQPLNCKIL